jgi:two-component system sensor histidine kinase KdpD
MTSVSASRLPRKFLVALAPAAGSRAGLSDYLWTAMMVAAVTVIGLAILRVLAATNIALLFLLPVMAAASFFGLRPGLFASLLSSLALNFFFLRPVDTLAISEPQSVLTIVVLLGVAGATSQLAARVRIEADEAASQARANAALAGFLGLLAPTNDETTLGELVCAEIGRLFGARAILATAGAGHGEHRVTASLPIDLNPIDHAAADWALDHGERAGRGTQTLTASDWQFLPIAGGEGVLAAIGLCREDGRDPIPADRLPLLQSLLDQAAIAIERARLTTTVQQIVQLKERDRLRAALLSSLGHDLRTPLTAIVAAAAELRHAQTPDLIATIEAESERLSRFVANLLDMARVEAGALRLNIEPTDLADALGAAFYDVRRALAGHAIVQHLAPNVPLVRVDPRLLHHILINLLDNAGRYADPGSPITIAAARDAEALVLSIADEGPGIPSGRERDIFETFHRIEGSDRTAGGTGLGLAIVKGFADAMGVAVAARSREDGQGACFTLRFVSAMLVDTEGLSE